MNFLPVLYLSFRNYFRHISRYALILCSLIMVTMVMITFLAVTAGVRASVLSKTSRYFAGDITVQAFELNKNGRFDRFLSRLLLPLTIFNNGKTRSRPGQEEVCILEILNGQNYSSMATIYTSAG